MSEKKRSKKKMSAKDIFVVLGSSLFISIVFHFGRIISNSGLPIEKIMGSLLDFVLVIKPMEVIENFVFLAVVQFLYNFFVSRNNDITDDTDEDSPSS